MTPKQFFKAGYLFENFYPEDMEKYFNYEEIEKIPNTEIYQLGVFALSQVLIGTNEEAIETLKEITPHDRKKILWTWCEIIDDIEQMRLVSRLIVSLT